MITALPLDDLVFVLAAFLGALVAGMAGFVFGVVASALWLHVVTPAQSAALIAGYAILIQGLTLWKVRHAIHARRVVPFVVGAIIGIPLGATVLSWAPQTHMRSLIGVLLILFSVYSLMRPQLPAVSGGPTADGVVGLLSGFFGGSTGLAGLPVIVWSKDEQRALFQPVVVAIFLMTLLWFGGTGHLPADTTRLFLVGLPGVVLGTWLGFKLYGKLDERTFRTVVLVLLLISGVTLLPWQ